MVDDRYYYFDTLGGWVLCFARCWRIDTHPASNRCNPDSRLASYWQKALEITKIPFLLKFNQIKKIRIEKCT